MNAIRYSTFWAFSLLFSLTITSPAVAGDASPTPPKPRGLDVQVNIPPSWQPMLEDRVADAFVAAIDDVFRRQGYQGEVRLVRRLDEPSPGGHLLTINLTEWRMNHTGNIDCTFTGNLQTDRTTRHLGVFTGIAFRWMSGPGRFGAADAFNDAAEQAVRQLYDALAKTQLVPGLTRR